MEVVFVTAVGAEPFFAAVETLHVGGSPPRLTVGIVAGVTDDVAARVDDVGDVALIVGQLVMRRTRDVEISAVEACHDDTVALTDCAVAVIVARRHETAAARYLACDHVIGYILKS